MNLRDELERNREAVDFIEEYTGFWRTPDEVPELLREDVLKYLRAMQAKHQEIADTYRQVADGTKEQSFHDHPDFQDFHEGLMEASQWDQKIGDYIREVKELERMIRDDF